MDLRATTVGLFPLPDEQRARLVGMDRRGGESENGAGESGDETAVFDAARKGVIAVQEDAGLDLVVEGQTRWEDVLAHPLSVHENVSPGGVVRYYDNNNFYREPVVVGELGPSGDLAADLGAAGELTDRLQAVVPGPYSLADLARNEYYVDDVAFLDAVAEFLAGELASVSASVECVFLLDPSLVTNPPDDDAHERVSEAVDAVARAVDAPAVVHTCWGAPGEKLHAHLLDADVSALGYDLVSAHEEATYLVQEYGTAESVSLGLVDGQNTLVEDAETIRERLRWFRESVPVSEFETVYVTPNTGLFYLPVSRFEAKLRSLGDATERPIEATR